MKKFLIAGTIVSSLLLTTASAFSWDGVNAETGNLITIDDNAVIAEGNVVQITDDSGVQRNVIINRIAQTDKAIQITLVDDTSGETQIYDFDPADMPDTVELPEPQ